MTVGTGVREMGKMKEQGEQGKPRKQGEWSELKS